MTKLSGDAVERLFGTILAMGALAGFTYTMVSLRGFVPAMILGTPAWMVGTALLMRQPNRKFAYTVIAVLCAIAMAVAWYSGEFKPWQHAEAAEVESA